MPKTPTENPRVRVCPLGRGEVLIPHYCAVYCPKNYPDLWERCPVRAPDGEEAEPPFCADDYK